MSKDYLFGDQFVSYMKSVFPKAKIVSGGRELQCRCKYCADSSDPNNPGHMYIKVPMNPDDPALFTCFKCQTSGVISSSTLLEWGIYDPNIAVSLDKNNALAARHNKFKGFSKEWFPFNNCIKDTTLAQKKLDYINGRIGTSLSFEDCMKQKIILNIGEVIERNRLDYTRHPNIVDQLNSFFVGFLSLDNNFVNLRRMCPEGCVYSGIDKRYINYNLHGKEDNTEKMYIMPTTIDLTKPKKVQIHIAEGPFDILSIRYNLRNDNYDHSIFAAVTGSGYKGLLKHIITVFNIFYFDLHIYPDNDKHGSFDMVNELASIVRPYNATVYEHRNIFEGEKDFGVTPDHIDERIYVHYPM